MTKVIAGIFLLLHGFVHLLYLGQSMRKFELEKGLTWPDGSWVFSRLLGENGIRSLSNIFCILTAIVFVIGAVGIFGSQSWWRTATVAAAAISIVTYLLFWNGKLQNLDGQGGVGILIDIAILLMVLVLKWPRFDF